MDWFTIEKVEHENRIWMEPVNIGGYNSYALRYSGRISDADVEGTAEEMLAIAAAIEEGGFVSFTRCGVNAKGTEVAFWSPRNSQVNGHVTHAEAKALAVEIRAKLERKVA